MGNGMTMRIRWIQQRARIISEVTEKTDCTELFRLFAVCLLVFSEYYRPKTLLAVPLVTSIIFSGVSPLRAAISSTTAEIMSEVHLVPLKGTGLR